VERNQVLIVGGGPVGLVNALGLARAGVAVTVLEGASAVIDSPRGMVYHWSVIAGLERLGLLDDVKEAGFTAQLLHYRVFRTGEIIPSSVAPLEGEVAHPYNLHLGQNKLSEIVLTHLDRLPNVDVMWNTTVTDLSQDAGGVTIRADAPEGVREFRADWVIGADGARSTVRRALGLDFDGMTWPERFVATNICFDYEQYGYAPTTYLVDPGHGAVISKIGRTGLWRHTYCESAELPEETVLERMKEYFRTVLPGDQDYELERHSAYSMHQRCASRFRVGRVILAGDAGHATNPTSGFGLTSGLFDSYVLSEALAAVVNGDADEEVLDAYAEQRRRVFLEFTSPVSSESKRLVFNSADPVRLDEDLNILRKRADDPALQRDYLLLGRKLETPSLLT
jgi:6-hydroxy-3-succinoylpyridine 3-monooxygenase